MPASGDILALYDREQRIEIDFPDMAKETTARIVRFLRPAPGMSFVLYSRLDEATADAAIDEQLAYFREHAQPFEWKVYGHDRPADLARRLAARGFECEEPEAIMVLELDGAPASLLSPADSILPAGATLRRVTDPAGIGDVAGVMSRVWNEDFSWMHDRFGEYLAIPGYMSLYVIDADGRPASAGWTYFTEGRFSGLWGGSTVEEHRGRGLYTALLAVRVQEARARGYRYLTIDAGDMSRPIVERHGFRLLARATACAWNPPG